MKHHRVHHKGHGLHKQKKEHKFAHKIGAGFQKIGKTVSGVVKRIGKFGDNILSSGEKLISKTSTELGNLEEVGVSTTKGIGNILSSPLMWIAGGIGAVILLPKIL